jgi:hypothetical protein
VKVPVASGGAVTSFSVVSDATRNATSNLTPTRSPALHYFKDLGARTITKLKAGKRVGLEHARPNCFDSHFGTTTFEASTGASALHIGSLLGNTARTDRTG